MSCYVRHMGRVATLLRCSGGQHDRRRAHRVQEKPIRRQESWVDLGRHWVQVTDAEKSCWSELRVDEVQGFAYSNLLARHHHMPTPFFMEYYPPSNVIKCIDCEHLAILPSALSEQRTANAPKRF